METETSLPDLPFPIHGKIVYHSYVSMYDSADSTPRTYYHPKTNLETLTPWTSFPNDIHQAIQFATTRAQLPSAPFNISAWRRKDKIVECEEALRHYAICALHDPVEEVLDKLGVKGRFALLSGCKVSIVGSPDFSWRTKNGPQLHTKLMVSAPVSRYLFKSRWFRLNIKLGGRWIWSTLLLLLIALTMTHKVPSTLSNKFMHI